MILEKGQYWLRNNGKELIRIDRIGYIVYFYMVCSYRFDSYVSKDFFDVKNLLLDYNLISKERGDFLSLVWG